MTWTHTLLTVFSSNRLISIEYVIRKNVNYWFKNKTRIICYWSLDIRLDDLWSFMEMDMFGNQYLKNNSRSSIVGGSKNNSRSPETVDKISCLCWICIVVPLGYKTTVSSLLRYLGISNAGLSCLSQIDSVRVMPISWKLRTDRM